MQVVAWSVGTWEGHEVCLLKLGFLLSNTGVITLTPHLLMSAPDSVGERLSSDTHTFSPARGRPKRDFSTWALWPWGAG